MIKIENYFSKSKMPSWKAWVQKPVGRIKRGRNNALGD
jgi:hypothetical protein